MQQNKITILIIPNTNFDKNKDFPRTFSRNWYEIFISWKK